MKMSTTMNEHGSLPPVPENDGRMMFSVKLLCYIEDYWFWSKLEILLKCLFLYSHATEPFKSLSNYWPILRQEGAKATLSQLWPLEHEVGRLLVAYMYVSFVYKYVLYMHVCVCGWWVDLWSGLNVIFDIHMFIDFLILCTWGITDWNQHFQLPEQYTREWWNIISLSLTQCKSIVNLHLEKECFYFDSSLIYLNKNI